MWYRRTKLQEGNVCTHVCLSKGGYHVRQFLSGPMFLRGGMMSLPVWSYVLSGGERGVTSRGRGIGIDWLLVVAAEAGGEYPTGMHSCLKSVDDPDNRATRGFVSWLWLLSDFVIALWTCFAIEINSVISQSTKLFSLFINLERRVLLLQVRKINTLPNVKVQHSLTFCWSKYHT